METKKHLLNLFIVFYVVFFISDAFANSQERFNEDLLRGFTYRNLGPFRTSAWIADIAVPTIPQEDHLYTFYVAARCGGLWKTTNNGTTFDPIFDSQSISAIGDVTLAPSDPNIVWVGTGGSENSRSAYSGDGVYKSTDGGKTWENMGLKDSHHIALIVIHPTSPDIVYVAAIGHLFSFNKQRGLFKTEDGGKTWEKVIYIDEKVGVIDVVMDPSNPDILYAATYQMQRLPWHFERGGPGSAIYKTIDAGKTWTRLSGIAGAGGSENRYVSRVVASNYRQGTAYVAKSGYRRDDFKPYVFKTMDFGATWESIANNLPDKPINVIFEDKTNPNLLFLGNDIGVYISINGGRRWVSMRNNMPAIMVHDLLVHPRENDLVVGTYGRGLYITDVTALQEMNEKILAEDIHLFKVEPKVQRIRGGWGWYRLFGSRRLVTPNEANALVINYYLKNKVSEKVAITITDPYGKEMARLRGSASSGMNFVSWDMRRRLTKEEEKAYMNVRSRDREPTSRMVPPGEYLVVLEVGDRRFIRKALIKKRAGWPVGSAGSSYEY